MCAYMEAIRKSSLWAVWAIAIVVVAVVLVFVGFSHRADALWEPVTPKSSGTTNDSILITSLGNPFSPLTGGTTATDTNTVYHVIKREGSSSVTFTEFDTYFSELDAGHYIELTDRVPATSPTNRCSIISSGFSSSDAFVTVTLTIQDPVPSLPAAQRTVMFNIPYGNICAPAATGGTNARGTNTGRFFARYPVPTGFVTGQVNRDDDTSLYRIKVRVAYSDTATLAVGSGPSNHQQILFKARTDTAVPAGCSATTCDRYIGVTAPTTGPVLPSGAMAPTKNYSTLGNTADPTTGIYTQQRFYFGLPCKETSSQRQRLSIYDLDNGSGDGSWGKAAVDSGRNRAGFLIQRSTNGTTWTTLADGDYLLRQDVEGAVTTTTGFANLGGTRVLMPKDGSSVTTNVEFTLQPKTRYRIIISPLYSNNLVNIGLPVGTRSIFGVLDCNVGLAGSIATSPVSGVEPIEAGRSIALTAQSKRSGNTDFISSYNYNFRVWYDTGDDVYNAADDGALLCNPNGNIADSNSATAPARTLNATPCVALADPSARGGRATAICSQLVLTRLPTDSVTNITTGAPPNGVIRCFHIGKYPHLEAHNGDIYAGGQLPSSVPTCSIPYKPIVSSSQRLIDGAYYSSYATYGVTSLGASLTFGSMGQSYGFSTFANDLVFANNTASEGYFLNATGNNNAPTVTNCLNDPYNIFGSRGIAGTSTGSTNVDVSLLTGDARLTATSTVNLYASTPIQPGRKIVIYANNGANIKITSNITYADQAYGSINAIPQIVVLTDKSLIVGQTSTVDGQPITQVDGIYAAKDNFYTCDLVPRLHLCEAPLRVNGAVVVGKNTVPLRTAGADATNYGAMAETFNLRSDMFLNQLPEAGGANVYIKTRSETEVPPRF